jgi:hypothetical protein
MKKFRLLPHASWASIPANSMIDPRAQLKDLLKKKQEGNPIEKTRAA